MSYYFNNAGRISVFLNGVVTVQCRQITIFETLREKFCERTKLFDFMDRVVIYITLYAALQS